MANTERIYLDNAATSWPKPPEVYAAVDRYLRENGAPAGRGAYHEAADVEKLLAECRARLARLIGAADPRHVIFTWNATDALNLALHGLLRRGDHVVTTVVEHNSVLRPLRFLEEAGTISVSRVACDANGYVDPAAVDAAITPRTRLVALIHASNVTGAVQPAAEILEIARRHGCLTLLDAAQTVGHWPVDVAELDVDLLAAAGHKGLLGPLGSGFLYVKPGIESQLRSIRQGGTGSQSDTDEQPEMLPDKYESGNLNVPALVGLAAGIRYVESQTVEQLQRHEEGLTAKLLEDLAGIAELNLHGPGAGSPRVGVVSMTLNGMDSREVATMLDANWRIQVRAGFHCAGRLHETLGTLQHGGTIRLSVGPFNTIEQLDATRQAIAEIASMQLDF